MYQSSHSYRGQTRIVTTEVRRRRERVRDYRSENSIRATEEWEHALGNKRVKKCAHSVTITGKLPLSWPVDFSIRVYLL